MAELLQPDVLDGPAAFDDTLREIHDLPEYAGHHPGDGCADHDHLHVGDHIEHLEEHVHTANCEHGHPEDAHEHIDHAGHVHDEHCSHLHPREARGHVDTDHHHVHDGHCGHLAPQKVEEAHIDHVGHHGHHAHTHEGHDAPGHRCPQCTPDEALRFIVNEAERSPVSNEPPAIVSAEGRHAEERRHQIVAAVEAANRPLATPLEQVQAEQTRQRAELQTYIEEVVAKDTTDTIGRPATVPAEAAGAAAAINPEAVPIEIATVDEATTVEAVRAEESARAQVRLVGPTMETITDGRPALAEEDAEQAMVAAASDTDEAFTPVPMETAPESRPLETAALPEAEVADRQPETAGAEITADRLDISIAEPEAPADTTTEESVVSALPETPVRRAAEVEAAIVATEAEPTTDPAPEQSSLAPVPELALKQVEELTAAIGHIEELMEAPEADLVEVIQARELLLAVGHYLPPAERLQLLDLLVRPEDLPAALARLERLREQAHAGLFHERNPLLMLLPQADDDNAAKGLLGRTVLTLLSFAAKRPPTSSVRLAA